jgi:hypothetical protein
MKRQYSSKEILQQNLSEASQYKNKKLGERNERINEERILNERLNQQLGLEKQRQINEKVNIKTQQMDEYSRYLKEKEVAFQSRRMSKNDTHGTFKIGGETREIKRRNYEEDTSNLVLNPMNPHTASKLSVEHKRGNSQVRSNNQINIQNNIFPSQVYNMRNNSLNQQIPDNHFQYNNELQYTPVNNRQSLPIDPRNKQQLQSEQMNKYNDTQRNDYQYLDDNNLKDKFYNNMPVEKQYQYNNDLNNQAKNGYHLQNNQVDTQVNNKQQHKEEPSLSDLEYEKLYYEYMKMQEEKEKEMRELMKNKESNEAKINQNYGENEISEKDRVEYEEYMKRKYMQEIEKGMNQVNLNEPNSFHENNMQNRHLDEKTQNISSQYQNQLPIPNKNQQQYYSEQMNIRPEVLKNSNDVMILN